MADSSSKAMASFVMASSSHRREIHQLKRFVVPAGIQAPEAKCRGGLPWTAAGAPRSKRLAASRRSWPIS